MQSGFLCYFIFIFGYILELANSYLCMPLYMSYRNCYRQKKKKKNQAMANESHYPAALVSVVSLKCVLRVAVNVYL